MSSHIFTEIERTCDRVAIIKDGRLVTVENIHDLQSMRRQVIDVNSIITRRDCLQSVM